MGSQLRSAAGGSASRCRTRGLPGWGRLIIEIDGYEFHSSRTHYRNDRDRWNRATVQGFMTLRITAETILRNPQEFIRLVRAAMAQP
ncbi:DUF559 domain-containing protein [Arthrobacter sp. 3Tela_A]|uniref:DUF559 domain-containing protein n=1 Tax=Arthrobacter sp. 3Tela_A TaxID=3093743 RepID=UPI003BB6D68E